MKSVALGFVFAAGVLFALPSQAATMSECAAQWKAAKAAKQTDGKTYREFSKVCMGGDAAKADAKTDTKADTATKSDLAKDAGAGDVGPAGGKKATAKKADKTEKPKSDKPKSAAASRQKECGTEWKADKAAGKVEKGMTWPKYSSACSKRKKGEAA